MKKAIITTAIALTIAVAAILLLLPAIAVDGESSPRARDMGNLHQIGLACSMFAVDHGSRFPDNWNQLTPYVSNISKLFVTWRNRFSAGAMTNVMEWTDYVYVRGLTADSPSGTVLAFLPPTTYGKTSVALVLFVDNHIESQTPAEFVRTMNRSPNAPEDTARKLAVPQR